jgi:TldD protein
MSTADYWESRQHELRKTRIVMIDGRLSTNTTTVEAGASARVRHGGYWGFASAPGTDIAPLRDQARRNALAMARFGSRDEGALAEGSYRGEHEFQGRAPMSSKDNLDRLAALQAHCQQRFPGLTSVRLIAHEETHRKRIATSGGSDALSCIQRAMAYVFLATEDAQGAPIEIFDRVNTRGSLADLDLSIDAMAPLLDTMHRHLQAKRHAVPARGGLHTVVMAPELAGMLAHEAMGHPCEADIVLAGAITGDLVGQRVASDLVTMVDAAHHFGDDEAPMPVYVDDEGSPARDALLIERGLLRQFMTSRETAARLGIESTGSARAYGPNDEPLVRMRNTVILPGTSKLDAMIAGVEDGYLLAGTSNGQADSTTEFMFGINLGYEIRNGQLGRAIRDTTVSGSAIKVLQSVDAVSDDMVWVSAGYCGKKQPMVVSMGGPALRARAHLGGV